MAYILGISAFYHDSSATLINNGKIISAIQEERLSRKKHDSSFPNKSIKYILDNSKIKLTDIDYVVFYEKPFLKFERLLETYMAFAPKGFKSFLTSIPLWIKEKLFQKKFIIDKLKNIDENFNAEKLFFSEHHLSHAASAFFPSPFNEAIVLTADGVGEWATTTAAIGKNNNLSIKKELHYPHSLGLLYSAFTYYCGFKVNSGEYKLMGLAPYGRPIFEKLILDNLIDLKEDGTFRLNQDYFDYSTGLTMTNDKFDILFDRSLRSSKDKILQIHMDIAASIQKVTEDIMILLVKKLKEEYHIPNLCLAGGVALNCVANGKILNQKIFDNIWIQPASGDAGGSLGAALAFWYIHLNNKRVPNSNDDMNGSYLGSHFNDDEIEKELKKLGANYIRIPEENFYKKISYELSKGSIIGWFQGNMEFGPRALGNRSILADPRVADMQKKLNLKIKYRESFRPFAPSILIEDVNDWFDLNCSSPYMLLVGNVKNDKIIKDINKNLFGIDLLNQKRSLIPSVTHVDFSSRIQTVSKLKNEKFYNLINNFKKITSCPILINTSFNVRGEPIVNTPEDAFRCFMGTDLDILVIGNYVLYKKEQNINFLIDYKNQFELD